MSGTYITLAVEDSLSEAVGRKIIDQSDNNMSIANCLGKKGFGYLKTKINAFNKAAKAVPIFVLADQDTGCPPDKINSWLNGKPNSNLIFRIAVMEIESWVMADRKALAEFLAISPANFPYNMDDIPDPKKFLLAKAKKSKKRALKEDIIPKVGSIAKIGPNYNARLSDFVRNTWDVHRAIRHSESLNRAFEKLRSFRMIPR